VLTDLIPLENTEYKFHQHDITEKPLFGFDAVYCLDVFEHIKYEQLILENLILCAPVAIIGTPSLESQIYASKKSKEGHVNCKSGNDFKILLKRYYKNVFLFSMNDEVVHTGFYPMAHYLIALCIEPL
jgi:2-polyprenyl-3-methyl-5-hydroxy-6-metoxy-1,4-benzoquinol methylase